jgi:hypothetical protein
MGTNEKTLCECTQMTCASPEAMEHMMATNHHPHCPKGWPQSARDLIAALVKGMSAWAADEDGVHTDAWDAYLAGRAALGLPPPKEGA